MNNKKKPSALLHVIIVAVTLAAIAVTIFFAQKNHRETIRLSTEQFNQQQLILARLAVVGIQHFMAEIEDEICTLSNSPAVQKMEQDREYSCHLMNVMHFFLLLNRLWSLLFFSKLE